MSEVTTQQLQQALATWQDPCLATDLVSAKAIRSLTVEGTRANVEVELGFPALGHHDALRAGLTQCLLAVPGITAATIAITTKIASHAVQKNLKPMKSVKNIIAVASGKGGVGKSTTAVNLALALVAEGARAGILDADIYGPSQPLMLGLTGKRPTSTDRRTFAPLEAHGLQCMSIGLMTKEDDAMVWRGPMVTQALTQLMESTLWKDLDYLIVDMPPGTGDIQLTLAQRVPVSGAVIVTTPQDIALLDARKGLKMFEKVGVSILGIVENMSTHICSNCGHEERIFGEGGGNRIADQYHVPLLGSLPLDLRIRVETDGGRPTVVAEPDSAIARSYREIARRMAARLSTMARDQTPLFPKITIEGE